MTIRIALIDDDTTEAMILEGMLEHADGDYALTHFPTVSAFQSTEDPGGFDLVFLDRRIPPFERFEDSLPLLEGTTLAAPVVLISAFADALDAYDGRLRLVGPVPKSDLLDPESVARVVTTTLSGG